MLNVPLSIDVFIYPSQSKKTFVPATTQKTYVGSYLLPYFFLVAAVVGGGYNHFFPSIHIRFYLW